MEAQPQVAHTQEEEVEVRLWCAPSASPLALSSESNPRSPFSAHGMKACLLPTGGTGQGGAYGHHRSASLAKWA